jgi:glycosyltransferase involved in cell wall biosynthesis
MHVAHFVHRYPPAVGGCEAYVERLGRFLADRGDGVTVWTSTAVDLEAMWQPPGAATARERLTAESRSLAVAAPGGVDVRRYSPLWFPGRRYVLKALSLLPLPPLQALTLPCNPVCPGMWRDAGRFAGPLDAVHAFAFPYAFPIACGLRLARRRGVPFLLTPFLHLGDPDDPRDRTRRQYTSRPLRWLLRQADRVFVQTPSEFDAVIRLGVPADRVILQGLGVDPADCTGGDREAARRNWGVGPGEVAVGHLANLSVEKGTLDLIRAAERAWATGVKFRLVLAGPDMPNFRRAWEAFPGKHRVTRLGQLTDAEKRDFFAGIDAFALPSRTDSFGLVLLEAWANGKSNLCYRAGGPADLIHDETDGLLARCGDIDGLAERLARLAADEGLRRRLGDAGRERVGREFLWEDKLKLVRDVRSSGCARRLRHPRRAQPELRHSLHLEHHEIDLPGRPQDVQ